MNIENQKTNVIKDYNSLVEESIEKIIKTTWINMNGLQKDNLSQWEETGGGEVL